LFLAASGAFAGGPMAQTEPRTAQGVANQSPSFGDDSTADKPARAGTITGLGLS
jgi:hypothetical protein